ncbi:NAAT family transporter [Labilibaculum sp. A4]|uniref:MarC family protein n=1 Tax=Labilibaculum euxinus TaxID=2686357 RepID=UPI000F6247C7|nr:MarC family protein [Labilibaculum euxinus]MDQ1772654.1 MarC family protein [Labilibaculum euxinus]MWN76768.1 NAAT family transporter [Labilibaculum euxinus]
MIEYLTYSLSVFTGFFAIMNPIANIPIFSSLVQDADESTKKTINKKATVIAFCIVFIFVLLGKFIFELFGITIPAFKITGGILLFYVGFEMLESKKSNIKHLQKVKVDENIAVSPLAIPILAGPGTIVTAMNFVSDNNYLHIGIVIFIFAIMCFITYLAFLFCDYIVEKIGHNIITVIGKIMGLILSIMGIGMIIQGIKLAFHLFN